LVKAQSFGVAHLVIGNTLLTYHSSVDGDSTPG